MVTVPAATSCSTVQPSRRSSSAMTATSTIVGHVGQRRCARRRAARPPSASARCSWRRRPRPRPPAGPRPTTRKLSTAPRLGPSGRPRLGHGQPHPDLHPDRRRRHDGARRLQPDRQDRPRLVAYADVRRDQRRDRRGDRRAAGWPAEVAALLRRVQNDLFDVGADLCTPLAPAYDHPPLRVQERGSTSWRRPATPTTSRWRRCARSSCPAARRARAHLHVARTVTRRAERSTWAAIEAYGTGEDGGVNPLTARYLNRLVRPAVHPGAGTPTTDAGGDVLWQPGGGRDR